MSTNMLSGERRWASARRGGMTVLGKVAVPKPLNLPSQRLENHGLDPGVEIVPKGTLGWGSRPSSSGSNAWISSSPNADGGTTSPSHLSGRPSSGGTGTRPSTAGSDRTHEPVASVWGSNSRPSSASGALASNQSSSTSLRPRSAETRQNSSQLSRFAEPVSESSVAWGPSSAAERLDVKSFKDDGFSLTSGDFPTLGSEKDNALKFFESQDHGRPSSASGRITSVNEEKYQADPKCGAVNTWRADGSRMEEDGFYHSMEKWQGEPQKYFNPNVAPQHFDAWRVPPVNAPAGVWHSGRPRGPAFGASGVSGGYPMEPFPYYRPQIPPPPALGGPQPVPPPGGGPRGPHPKNGYRPHMPDSYARPGMSFRHGFYPGPRGASGPMAFEGYYGPPMGYCNNERDIPYMGMPAAPRVFNCYPGANDPPDTVHERAGRRAVTGKTTGHMEADHLEEAPGQKRLSLKSNNEWDQEEVENWEHSVLPSVSHPGKGILPMRTSEWGADDDDSDRDLSAKRRIPSENSSHSLSYRDHYSDSGDVKSFGGTHSVYIDDGGWTNKSRSSATFRPQISQLSVASERESLLLPATKDPAFMQKIEGLNAKIRASDGQNYTPSAHNREEQKTRYKVDQKANINTSEVGETVGDFVPVPQEVIGPAVEKQMQPMVVVPRRSYHGGQGRIDHRGKGNFNNQDTDGWRRKPLTPESPSPSTASNMECVSDPSFVGDAANNYSISFAGKVEGESVTEAQDSTDKQAQRVKMRELAKQRALQRQKEEEERIKEQKAKALAKLEELNRRTLTGEAADQKAERTLVTSDIQGEEEESRTDGDAVILHPPSQAPSRNPVSESDITVVDREKINSKAGKFVQVLLPDAPQTGVFESIVSHGPTLPTKENSHTDDRKAALQSNELIPSTHKRTVSKHKQNSMLQKSSIEKPVPNSTSEMQKDDTGVTAVDVKSIETASSESRQSVQLNVHDISNTVSVPATTIQRKKANKNTKNKHKVDETQAVYALPPVISKVNPEKKSIPESKSTLSKLDTPVSTVMEPEVSSVFPSEQSKSRSTNNLKPQPVRKTQRTQQANRITDKAHGGVIWAPVRTQNKAEDSVEESQKSTMESANLTKSDNLSHNSLKGKRAEMERYVPKPVAKELAQQGSIPLLSSSICSSRSEEVPVIVQFGSVSPESIRSINAFVESSLEIKGRDGRHSKHKKEHGHWQKQGAGPSPISEPSKGTQISLEQNQPVKSDKNSANSETNTFSNVDSGGWDDMSNKTTASGVNRSALLKDQGGVGRGKRRMPGPGRAGNNPDHENISGSETDRNSVQLAAPAVNHSERAVDTKERRNTGEQISHWKPKSHLNSTNKQHMNKPCGTETVTTEINKPSKKDHPLQHKLQVPPQHDKESSIIDHSLHDSNVAKESITGNHHQGFNREKKPISAKGHSSFREQDPWESAPAAITGNQRERSVSGYSRSGGQSNRYAKGHENHGDWRSEPRYMPASRERQRHNVQYEYQPMGPNKGGILENHDGPANNAAQRYGGIGGQSHSKRGGNYHRSQVGNVRVESGQD